MKDTYIHFHFMFLYKKYDDHVEEKDTKYL